MAYPEHRSGLVTNDPEQVPVEGRMGHGEDVGFVGPSLESDRQRTGSKHQPAVGRVQLDRAIAAVEASGDGVGVGDPLRWLRLDGIVQRPRAHRRGNDVQRVRADGQRIQGQR